MTRSKYIADQAVEAARLSVLKASEAERLAVVAKQEAESLNNRFVIQAGKEAAREGYKAAHAGQNATVIGQQTAVWEDPNLPPKDITRQLEYVARLIDSVVDKAAEVAYAAARMAQDFGKEDLSKELAKGRVDERDFWRHLIAHWVKRVPKSETEDIEAQLQECMEEYNIEAQIKERARKQTDLKYQVHFSTRTLANLLANHDMPIYRKPSRINEKAIDIISFIRDTERAARPEEGNWNSLIHYVVMLARQQVTLANYICALVASRIPQAFSKVYKEKIIYQKKSDDIFYRNERKLINDILEYAEIDVRYMEIIESEITEKRDSILEKLSLYKNGSKPMIGTDTIIDIDIRRMKNELDEKLFPEDEKTSEEDAQKNSQLIDEKAAQVAQAMDTAVAKVDKSILYLGTLIEDADKSVHSQESVEHQRIENVMDQLTTLASRAAILARQECIVVWSEESEEEKKDDPQVLEAVTVQIDKIAKEAAQAAESASQAAKRAGQSVTQLMPDLNKSFQISNLVTQSIKWYTSVPSEVRQHIARSCSETKIRSSLDEVQRVFQEADTACKEARNVYEKIEQARRDAEQFCKKGIIAAQSVSWWPVWPWSFPPPQWWWLKWLWPNPSNDQFSAPREWIKWLWPNPSHNQLKEAAKQSSEAVDQVGQAAVLAGQAVAQSGQAVTQASQAAAMLGQVITRHPHSNSPLELQWLQKSVDQIIPVAQQVGTSVAGAGQTSAQASQAANNVALAAQTVQKTTKTVQAVQQIEWLTRGRQKWIFGLSIILSLVSICVLLLLPILGGNSIKDNPLILRWIMIAIGIGAIVDSCLLMTALVENIKKMTRMFHRLLTLFCCALFFLLAGCAIFSAFQADSVTFYPIVLVSIPLFIILPAFVTGIAYYQHCTLNNLHPYEVPTSELES